VIGTQAGPALERLVRPISPSLLPLPTRNGPAGLVILHREKEVSHSGQHKPNRRLLAVAIGPAPGREPLATRSDYLGE
jgi:hypothetical protein